MYVIICIYTYYMYIHCEIYTKAAARATLARTRPTATPIMSGKSLGAQMRPSSNVPSA